MSNHRKYIYLLLMVVTIPLAGLMGNEPKHPLRRRDATASTTQPNIVVILIDDLDGGLMQTLLSGGYLSSIQTHLVDAGTTFDNAFVSTPLCCPSRATFLTGQYSHNHGVIDNRGPSGGVIRLDDSSTLATWLHDAGYVTGYVGKYLNEYGSDANAPTTSPLHPTYVPPKWDYWRALVDWSTYKMYDYRMNFNGRLVDFGNTEVDYQTDVLASLAARFVHGAEQSDSQPFFLVISPLAVHQERGQGTPTTGCEKAPWRFTLRPALRHIGWLAHLSLPQPPSFNEADNTDKPPFVEGQPLLTDEEVVCAERAYRDRAEAMLAVDDLVLTVGKALRQNGEVDNTIVIFTSDNGYYLGEHRLHGKNIGYEEGIRVPLIIRAPGYTAPQRTIRHVLNTDLAPTIMALAAVTTTLPMDGRSLLPLLQEPALASWRRRFLVEDAGELTTMRNFTAVRTTELDLLLPARLYVQWGDGSVEYYDLATDLYQIDSRHDDADTLEARLSLEQHLIKLRSCRDGTCQLFEDAD